MYRYALLDTKSAAAFAQLTYDRYRSSLTDEIPTQGIIAIGAYQLWQPIGLLMGFYKAGTQEARVLSLNVVPEHQKGGVGTELLSQFETLVRTQGCQSIIATYVGDNLSLERAFAKQGWDDPKTIQIAIESHVNRYEMAPIYKAKLVLPQDFEVFDWESLTAEDRIAIQTREAQDGGWYTASKISGDVSPFFQEEFLDTHCSIGLRYQGAVVGWMLIHRVQEDLLHFTSLFVSPEYRRQNLGIMLVMFAVKRVVDYYRVNNPTIRVFWQFAVENTVMEQLVEEHLAPYAITFNREKTIVKKLS